MTLPFDLSDPHYDRHKKDMWKHWERHAKPMLVRAGFPTNAKLRYGFVTTEGKRVKTDVLAEGAEIAVAVAASLATGNPLPAIIKGVDLVIGWFDTGPSMKTKLRRYRKDWANLQKFLNDHARSLVVQVDPRVVAARRAQHAAQLAQEIAAERAQQEAQLKQASAPTLWVGGAVLVGAGLLWATQSRRKRNGD